MKSIFYLSDENATTKSYQKSVGTDSESGFTITHKQMSYKSIASTSENAPNVHHDDKNTIILDFVDLIDKHTGKKKSMI